MWCYYGLSITWWMNWAQLLNLSLDTCNDDARKKRWKKKKNCYPSIRNDEKWIQSQEACPINLLCSCDGYEWSLTLQMTFCVKEVHLKVWRHFEKEKKVVYVVRTYFSFILFRGKEVRKKWVWKTSHSLSSFEESRNFNHFFKRFSCRYKFKKNCWQAIIKELNSAFYR